jgi:TnpA family transposase
VINQRRGDANRLGFAVLPCSLRYRGRALSAGELPPNAFLTMVARQLGLDAKPWAQYCRTLLAYDFFRSVTSGHCELISWANRPIGIHEDT